ncbi:MAG: hypothetical protein ACI845_002529 [Gammaproteobacteria bacterium]|jgi:hypothetical protein
MSIYRNHFDRVENMNKYLVISFVIHSIFVSGCSEDSSLSYTPPSLDTPETVYVGKSTAPETINAVYLTGSADITITIDDVEVNMVSEGGGELFGYGDALGTIRSMRNAPIITDELGIHAMRSLVFTTSGEEHTSAESYFYVRDARGGINLIGGTSLSNFANTTESTNLNITVNILPDEIASGESWFSLAAYTPFVNNGASLLFPKLLSTNAVAPFSGEPDNYLFWYRDHYLFAGEYYARSAFVYHKAGVGLVEFVTSIDTDINGNIIATSGSSTVRDQGGSGIINEITEADIIQFERSIADVGSTATNKFNNIVKLDADDISNPTGYDWIDVTVKLDNPFPGQRGYAVHLAYPAVDYNVSFNSLTDPVFSGAFSPVLEIDINNDGIWDYIADNSSELSVRTDRLIEPFSANEPRNYSGIFISGSARSGSNPGETLELPIDSTARTTRDVYLQVFGYHDVVNNGEPYLYITGLTDNQLPDSNLGSPIPVRVSIENIDDKKTGFDIQQYELIWATTVSGVAARENVLSYLDTDFVPLGVAQSKPVIPAQSSIGTLYFQLILKTNVIPSVIDNQAVLDITTPVYTVNIVDKSSIELSPPTPQIFISPTSGSAPLTISAYIGGSTDSDGLVDTIITDFGNGEVNENSINGGEYTYTHDGDYPLTYYVVDNDGLTSSYTQLITVSSVGTLKLFNQHEVGISDISFSEVNDLSYGDNRIASTLLPSSSTSFGNILEGQYDYRIALTDGRIYEDRFVVAGGQETVIEVSRFLIP